MAEATDNPVIELSQQVFDSRYFSFSQAGELAGLPVTLFFGGIEHCHPDYRINRHGFPVHILEYVDEGRGRLVLDGGEEQELRKGCLFLYGPGIPCRIMNTGERPLVKYFLTFLSRAGDLREHYQLDRLFFTDFLDEERTGDLVKLLFHEAGKASEDSWRICCQYLDVLLRKCSRISRTAQQHREPAWQTFNRVREAIEDNYLELSRMEDIGRVVDLDVSYISRLFKRYHHLTPYQFLQRKKMEHALDLLRQGTCSVQETARHVGFDDPFHFSRLFRKFKGVSPSQIRPSAGS